MVPVSVTSASYAAERMPPPGIHRPAGRAMGWPVEVPGRRKERRQPAKPTAASQLTLLPLATHPLFNIVAMETMFSVPNPKAPQSVLDDGAMISLLLWNLQSSSLCRIRLSHIYLYCSLAHTYLVAGSW